MTELYARQTGTATALAAAVGEPVNKVSFHLRLLARYGFIEEAPELARDGRDRWWRPSYADGLDWDDLALSHPGVVHARMNAGLRGALKQIEDYFSGANQQLPAWKEGVFSHDWYLRVTPQEAEEFNQEYLAMCFRWRDRMAEVVAREGEEGRESFAIYIYGFPLSKPPEALKDA
jgi:hypothetical protein